VRVVVLGGTKGMGRELARRLAERGDSVFLIGRNAQTLEEACTDLSVRGARKTGHAPCDLSDASSFAPALDAAAEALQKIDAIVVTAGLFGSQEDLEADRERLATLLDVNFTKTILFCEEARTRLMAQGGGTLVAFSSVAGDRGRAPVALYGATKAGLSKYLEALDHRYRDQGLVTICVKPGFVKTGMTEGLKPPPFAGEPDEVAAQVVRAMDRGTPEVYAPGIWRLVMLVFKHLPRLILRKVHV